MTLDALCEYALSLYGIPYQWGGEGPDGVRNYGFDCSGYVRRILRFAGHPFAKDDFTAHSLYLHLKETNCKRAQDKGAIAFFGTTDRISHVGFMLTPDIMINAAGGGPGCKTPKDARAMHAMVKIQPLDWYKSPPFVASYLPNYGF